MTDAKAERTPWWGTRAFQRALALPDRHLLPALIVAALLPRLLFVAAVPHDDAHPGELNNVAVSFAEQGYLGNPYGFQTGPSAHVAPGYAVVQGLFIRAAGSRHAGFQLARVLTALVAATLIGALPAIAARLGLSRSSGLLASLVLLVPLFPWLETSGDWEAPYTAAALAACLAASWAGVSRGRLALRSAVATGVVWGMGLLFSPSIAPVLLTLHGLALVRWRRRIRRYLAYAGTVGVVALLTISPYLLRIHRELGGVAFIRSNLGLELAVSNNDDARPTLNANLARGGGMTSHPYLNEPEAMRVRRMGELAYNRARMAQARGWITTHPVAFAKLTGRRVALFWLPRSVRWYQTLLFVVALVGAVGFVIGLRRESPFDALLFASVPLSYSAIYAFVQTDPRYSYPVLWLHALLCAELARRILGGGGGAELHARPGAPCRKRQAEVRAIHHRGARAAVGARIALVHPADAAANDHGADDPTQ